MNIEENYKFKIGSYLQPKKSCVYKIIEVSGPFTFILQTEVFYTTKDKDDNLIYKSEVFTEEIGDRKLHFLFDSIKHSDTKLKGYNNE